MNAINFQAPIAKTTVLEYCGYQTVVFMSVSKRQVLDPNLSLGAGAIVNSAEIEFLMSEFNQSWEMIRSIETRRSEFLRFFSLVFLGVLSVATSILDNNQELTLLVALGLSSLFFFTLLSGSYVVKVLKQERAANVRYRKKINLIRELVLQASKGEAIDQYLSTKGLGINQYSKDEQPSGLGSTLPVIFHLIALQQVACALSIGAIWIVYF